jgi:exoribonuclease R
MLPSGDKPCPVFAFSALQVRANGLIVFVPKYGIEGPVYLEDSAAAAAAADGPAPASGGRKKGAPAAAAAADSLYVYDEEKQTVRSKDGSTHYTVFDKCAVRCAGVGVGGASHGRMAVWWACLCCRMALARAGRHPLHATL